MQEEDSKLIRGSSSNWEQEFLEQGDDAHIKTAKIRYRCPKCESLLVLKTGANGEFWGCESYPNCDYTANNENGKPVRAKRYFCPACQSPLRKKSFKDNVFGDAPITLNAKSPLKMTMAFLQVQKNTLAGFVATI